MTEHEATGPYVYQPFGMQHPDHWAAKRLWGAAGVGSSHDRGLVTIKGLTKMEANAVQAALASEPNLAVMLLGDEDEGSRYHRNDCEDPG